MNDSVLTIYACKVSQCCIFKKETKTNLVEVSGYGVANGRIWGKKIDA